MSTLDPTKTRLGDILYEHGFISQEQLTIALSEQKKRGLRLGEVLIELQYLEDTQLSDILSTQFDYARYDPDKYYFDPLMSDIIPAELARLHNIVPLEKEGSLQLFLAMVDPLDINSFDRIESVVGRMAKPVLVTKNELNQLINEIYGAHSKFTSGSTSESIDLGLKGSHIHELEVTAKYNKSKDEPVIGTVNWMISEAIQQRASDIHLNPKKDSMQLRFRVDGVLKEMPAPPYRMLTPIISRIKVLSKMDISRTMVAQDGRFTVHFKNREVNIRVSTVPTIHGENLVMRLLDSSLRVNSLDQLGMSPEVIGIIKTAVTSPYGMILATGPTGSGKSTTLYTLLSLISSPKKNIMTVEDPVEYRIDNIQQVQLNEKAGMTFATALRSLLRQDPDVLMVGEIRDKETANIACRAALTGHLVFSSVHTNTAAAAISRMLHMGIASFILASVLCACVAQRLVRRICSFCNKPHENAKLYHQAWNLSEDVNILQAVGCSKCLNAGYSGRVGLYEVLLIDREIKQMIFDGKSDNAIENWAIDNEKMHSLKEAARQKMIEEVTTPEEVISAVMSI